MDAEFRDAFAKLSSQIADVGRDAKQAVNLSKETAHEVSLIKSSVAQLNKAVFGSPDPPSGAGEISTPLVKKVSSSDLEVDSVKAQLIVLNGEIDSVKKMNEVQTAEIAQIKTAIVGFTGKVTRLLNNPKLIAIGRFAFASIMAYGVAKGWVVK